MADLTALIEAFQTSKRVAAVLVRDIVAVILLLIKSLLFNFPPDSASMANGFHII